MRKMAENEVTLSPIEQDLLNRAKARAKANSLKTRKTVEPLKWYQKPVFWGALVSLVIAVSVAIFYYNVAQWGHMIQSMSSMVPDSEQLQGIEHIVELYDYRAGILGGGLLGVILVMSGCYGLQKLIESGRKNGASRKNRVEGR